MSATRSRFPPALKHPLDALFAPRSIAIVGATDSPDGVGTALVRNLSSGPFKAALFPVDPARADVLGIKAFASLSAIPRKIDLAIIARRSPDVPDVIDECAALGIPGALIVSAGFKECGPEGAALEQKILATARRAGIRIIGPNCLGVMMPHTGLNATFAVGIAQPGHVAFISQSGALCTAILDWSRRENVGFSAFVSVGSMLDVGWGDLIDYLGDDPRTHSIVIYMESIGNARAFLSAAREVALTKPIIVVKVGRTDAAARAAASHTGALTGSDEVLEAAFRRTGVLRVDTIEDLFDMAEVLAKQPRPRGPRLAIVSNAGGPGALAVDRLAAAGGQAAPLSPGTLAELDRLLPPHWSHGNPVDILGDADAARYAAAVELVARDPACDGVLVILTPQARTDAKATAERMKSFAALAGGKPLLASWMGGPALDEGRAILNAARIPTFEYPDRAAQAFDYMWRYSANVTALYETPVLFDQAVASPGQRERAAKIITAARKQRRTILTGHESKQILAAYGIATVDTFPATTEDEAVALAIKIGFPVAAKLHSETITHKSDVGGVRLGLRHAADVRSAWRAIKRAVTEKAGAHHFLGVTVERMVPADGYELILGSSIDPQLGPVLLFGAGGHLVEILQDRALGLPPLNATLARRLMEQTKIYRALKGFRGRPPVDLPALEQTLVRFSQLVAEQHWISEIDINPLFASAENSIALDARIILHASSLKESQLPKLAIRPYPHQYAGASTLLDGTPVITRPIRPEDEPLMVKFHEGLSDRSVYYRYFAPLPLEQRIAHPRLARICFVDYDREIALVATHEGPKHGQPEILGVGRLCRKRGKNEAEFALLVSDHWQNRGLGTQLLKMLVRLGREEGLDRISGTILPENHEMRHVCERAGFRILTSADHTECEAEIRL